MSPELDWQRAEEEDFAKRMRVDGRLDGGGEAYEVGSGCMASDALLCRMEQDDSLRRVKRALFYCNQRRPSIQHFRHHLSLGKSGYEASATVYSDLGYVFAQQLTEALCAADPEQDRIESPLIFGSEDLAEQERVRPST